MSDVAGIGATAQRPSALRLASAILRGETSAREQVQICVDRIGDLDERLGAFVTLDFDAAERQAAEADRAIAEGRQAGPLHGVPVAIKDLTPTEGLRTTFGSRAFEDFVPTADAESVARIRAAGLVIIGKTATPEFGSLPVTESAISGSCRNPFNADYNAGGSSGGSACALAAGCVPIAHGTDAAGSVRVPASFCGVVGLKPSRGRISLAPRAQQRLEGWATEGPIAHTVEDAAALLDVMSGPVLGDPYWQPAPERPFRLEVADDPEPQRIAVAMIPPSGPPIEPEVADALGVVADRLSDLGHTVEVGAPEWNGSEAAGTRAVWGTLTSYYRVEDDSLLERGTRELASVGRATSASEYVAAVVGLQQLARRIARFWRRWDFLLTPVAPMTAVANCRPGAPSALRSFFDEVTTFTRWANITGQPALALPSGHRGPEGIPIGVQLMGAPGADAALVKLAAQLERATPATHLPGDARVSR